ncbi:MAG: rhomboid family intramembrane serine protease [Xanthomonadales bacterium]|nr:rhomboid family intramembrane serine protease [Xanthomonadales bacterium]ODU95071.1 MAG: rhomboid family intramembrane serine protease [Rhodanobacter sp. SCN 66-43]OJY82186.1 MAG: rhomboid family intramembrane serine protease [Xanthomonadales bacterium 66-474]
MFVDVPSRRHAHPRWVTPVLVVACVACYLWLMLSAPALRDAVLADWGTVPAHLFRGWETLHGWLWLRLFTSLFMHADWLHLLGNMLFLVIFGLPAERALGSRRFLALFLIGGAFANLIGAWTLSGQLRPIIGCSGAVSATLGAYLALFPRAHLGLVLPLGLYLQFIRVPAALLIGMWVLLQLLFTWAGPGFGTVVWWAHLAGFGFGILFAIVSRGAVERRLRQRSY